MPRKPSADAGDAPLPRRANVWIARAFPLHLRAFVVVNFALNAANVFVGTYWWAFWPLAATGFLFALHYLAYKTVSVDERWVDERIQELNLKSYDRSHIEGLKERYGEKNAPDDRKG
jgi:hypothetical protein